MITDFDCEVKLALQLPLLVKRAIPLLRRGRNSSVSLFQQQIASLLANAFPCTFPTTKHIMETDDDMETATYAQINLNSLFKLKGRSAAKVFHTKICPVSVCTKTFWRLTKTVRMAQSYDKHLL